MAWATALLIVSAALVCLLILGQRVAFALMVAGTSVLVLRDGTQSLSTLGSITYNAANNFTLTAVPMFILMGEFVLQGGISDRFFRGVGVLFRRVPGSLFHANIAASALFSAVSGSTVATAATMGTVALPALDRAGYSRRLSFFTLGGGGMLGMLIPPSLGALVYAALVEVSVADMFLAGVGPALVLMALLVAFVAVQVVRAPGLAPAFDDADTTVREALTGILPIAVLMVLVLGSIYGGVATPTEAAAIGAVGGLVVAVVFGSLDFRSLVEALKRTVGITCMIMFLVVGSQVLSFALVDAGATRGLVDLIAGLELSQLQVFIGLMVFYVLLGTIVDGVSIMLITIPVVVPIILAVGFDPYWFGVLLIMFIELGQLTPPVGLLLYVFKGIAPDTAMPNIVRGTAPVVVIMLIVAVLMFAFPSIVLWLPSITS